MGLIPCFSVVANNSDITTLIEPHYESIKITDGTGFESDSCEIVLIDDPLNPIALPPVGAELRVSMGYDGDLVDMGLFVVDEIELDGPPERMTIRAHAAINIDSKQGMIAITSQKTRSWPKNTTIADIVKKIAGEHQLQAKISDSLANIKLAQISQSDESDLNFLLRLAKKHDAICKPAGGKLLFIKRGENDLPKIEISRFQLSSWRMAQSTRNRVKSIIAYYYAYKTRKSKKASQDSSTHKTSNSQKAKITKVREEIKVGDGEPVRRLRHPYTDADSARMAAQSALAESQRGELSLNLTMVGNPMLSAEMPLVVTDVRDGIDGEWIISQVSHTIDKQDGFKSEVDAVKSLTDEGNEEYNET